LVEQEEVKIRPSSARVGSGDCAAGRVAPGRREAGVIFPGRCIRNRFVPSPVPQFHHFGDKTMTTTKISRRGLMRGALAGTTGALLAAPFAARAQSPAVTWRMQALWDGGTTPQKFEERFVARV